jgi:two-component system, LuxR family, response regulator FixJ
VSEGSDVEGVNPRVVAVIDDDHGVRASLRLVLEVAGYVVETFESAPEFLRTEIPDVACLILDHHMPHMTGLQLAGRLRARGTEMPILLITAWPSPALRERAALMGIKILEKPLREEDLLAFVNAA